MDEILSRTVLGNLSADAYQLVRYIIVSLVIYFVGSKLINWVTRLIQHAFDKTKLDPSLRSFVSSLLRIVLKVLLIILIAGYVGFNTSSLVALLTSAGVTVGLSFQGALSNLAGGILILIVKPFKVGDYISACGEEGTVSSIEFFYTKLMTWDGRLVVIPNGTLMNSNIANNSVSLYRQIEFKFGVSYQSDPAEVRNACFAAANMNPYVVRDEEHPMRIYVSDFADSAILFGVRLFVEKNNYLDVKFSYLEELKRQLDERGIEIPFNQLEVSIKEK